MKDNQKKIKMKYNQNFKMTQRPSLQRVPCQRNAEGVEQLQDCEPEVGDHHHRQE